MFDEHKHIAMHQRVDEIQKYLDSLPEYADFKGVTQIDLNEAVRYLNQYNYHYADTLLARIENSIEQHGGNLRR